MLSSACPYCRATVLSAKSCWSCGRRPADREAARHLDRVKRELLRRLTAGPNYGRRLVDPATGFNRRLVYLGLRLLEREGLVAVVGTRRPGGITPRVYGLTERGRHAALAEPAALNVEVWDLV